MNQPDQPHRFRFGCVRGRRCWVMVFLLIGEVLSGFSEIGGSLGQGVARSFLSSVPVTTGRPAIGAGQQTYKCGCPAATGDQVAASGSVGGPSLAADIPAPAVDSAAARAELKDALKWRSRYRGRSGFGSNSMSPIAARVMLAI